MDRTAENGEAYRFQNEQRRLAARKQHEVIDLTDELPPTSTRLRYDDRRLEVMPEPASRNPFARISYHPTSSHLFPDDSPLPLNSSQHPVVLKSDTRDGPWTHPGREPKFEPGGIDMEPIVWSDSRASTFPPRPAFSVPRRLIELSSAPPRRVNVYEPSPSYSYRPTSQNRPLSPVTLSSGPSSYGPDGHPPRSHHLRQAPIELEPVGHSTPVELMPYDGQALSDGSRYVVVDAPAEALAGSRTGHTGLRGGYVESDTFRLRAPAVENSSALDPGPSRQFTREYIAVDDRPFAVPPRPIESHRLYPSYSSPSAPVPSDHLQDRVESQRR